MLYGDGDGTTWGPLTSLDIGAHEIGHGITEFAGGLIYQGESGALNESFSDIFGELVENYSRGTNDWLLGADIILDGSDPLRNMAEPNLGIFLPSADTYMGDFWLSTSDGFDNGGVHFNSGVQNKWFYLMVEGEVGTNDNGDNYNVTGMGVDDAAAIAYHNLTTYLTPGSTFQDAREGAVQSAKDLFGTCSTHVTTTREAWRAVGVYGGGSSGLEISSLEHVGEATGVFTGGLSSSLAVAGTTDITVCLDAGQRISVGVEGSGGLQPSIQVLDPADVVVGTETSYGN
jgi:Zn-dependent metalloprotease